MKRMTLFVAALALALSLTQCKKEQSETPETQGVMITLNLEGASTGSATNGAKMNVDPYAAEQVTFEDGDQILVASGGQYVGTLTRENNVFSGSVTDPVEGQRLYFYFLGNKQGTLEAGTTTCTVNISDQTEELPVISMGQSTVNYTEGETSYSSRLYNKASLMKFNVTTPSEAAICITGMNNTVTVNFGEPTEANYGFTYGIDAEDGGLIKMPGVTTENTETWAIVLPQAALEAGGEGTVYTSDNAYTGTRPAMDAIAMNTFINGGFALTVNTEVAPAGNTVDLSNLTGNYEAQDGDVLSGTLANNVKISIAEGASVTLSNANINENGTWTDGDYAGITCLGNATIILEGTNTVKGFKSTYPGVQAGPDGTTLTIGGSGTLNATGGSDGAAGIGSGKSTSCGNITINGGNIEAWGGANGAGIGTGYCNVSGSISCGIITITGGMVTAYGGENAAGIGAGQSRNNTKSNVNNCNGINISGGIVTAIGGENAAGIGSGYARGTRSPISSCGDINITGGTVVATGGSNSAGIGTGNTYDIGGKSNCGNITITTGVTSVTATKGTSARDSIGRGKGKGTCGTVMFGDETIYDGSLWIIAPESGSAYGGLSFSITTVTNTDDTWVLQPE